MKVPKKGKIYSINEGYAKKWSKGLGVLIDLLFNLIFFQVLPNIFIHVNFRKVENLLMVNVMLALWFYFS